MEYHGPYVARFAFSLFPAIDWTHLHHEQTYETLSEKSPKQGTLPLVFSN